MSRYRVLEQLAVAVLAWTIASVAYARVVVTDAPSSTGANADIQLLPLTPQALPSLAETPRTAAKPALIASKRVSVQVQHGLRLLHGLQGAQDLKQAGYVFMQAFARGDAQAPAAVAYCTLLGCYGTPDYRSVALWIERARVRERGKAELLKWAAAEQFSTPGSEAQRTIALREAAALQDPVALNEQGLQQLSAGQRSAALKSFELAYQKGSPAAARNLNLLIQQPDNRAGTVQRSSASLPSPGSSLYEQAKRYHLGQGVPINDVQAIELYRQAANLGHLQAKRMLQLIFSRSNPLGRPDPEWMRVLAQQQQGLYSLETQATAIWPQKDISLLADWLPIQ